MKKLLSLLSVMALSVSMLAGCSQPKEPAETPAPTPTPTPAVTEHAAAEPTDVRAMALKGPTAIGLIHFIDQADQQLLEDNRYQFTLGASGDEVLPKLVQGEVDIAAIPANLSAVAYNKTEGQIQVLGINTLGVLNILESGDTIHSVADLKGRTLLATGKNHTPEQVLTYLLAQNGMTIGEDVQVEWKSEAAECLAALSSDPEAVAMLPQPFASAAQIKNENLRVALDLTAEWDRLQENSENPSALVTGVVVARKAFVAEHPEAVSAFMDHYKESVEFVNSSVEEAAQLVEKYDIVKAPVARKAIPMCNIVWLEGAEMQNRLSGYLQVLFDQNPKSVGGALPGDDFYFAR